MHYGSLNMASLYHWQMYKCTHYSGPTQASKSWCRAYCRDNMHVLATSKSPMPTNNLSNFGLMWRQTILQTWVSIIIFNFVSHCGHLEHEIDTKENYITWMMDNIHVSPKIDEIQKLYFKFSLQTC
jgi:hypothetical protein